MKSIKRIAAFVLTISFCFVLMLSPGAHAQGAITGQQFGAWIGSALVSINLIGNVLRSSSLQEDVEAMHALQRFLGQPTIQELAQQLPTPYDVYTFDDAAVTESLNTSIIKIRQGVTTIDGKQYDELWVSPEGAQKLKTNIFDFVTKYNLISNDTSTLAHGSGYAGDIPIYNVNGINRSQAFQVPVINGTYEVPRAITIVEDGGYSNWKKISIDYDDGVSQNVGTYTPSKFPISFYLECRNVDSLYVQKTGDSSSSRQHAFNDTIFDGQPFQYSFVSGEIPAPEDIPSEYGMSVKIPHEKLSQFYEDYPDYDRQEATIDISQDQVDISELTDSIYSMIESMNEIKTEWTNGEAPVPVDPIENIDQNVSDISQYQADMQQQVDHMHQDVESIHQTQQQQQQTQQQIQQDTSSIDDTLKDVTETPGQSDLPSFKIDLRELFPFCIPFDIYRLLSSFDATPTAPHVQLPIVIQSIGFNYTLDLDFSAWNPVAQAMRTAELIVYAIGLAWATGKVIKW